MMVSVRRSNNGGRSTFRVTLYAAILAFALTTAIYLLSNDTMSSSASSLSQEEEVSPHKAMMTTTLDSKKTVAAESSALRASTGSSTEEYERDEEGGDLMTITQGSVIYETTQQHSSATLDYYHCGPLPNTKKSTTTTTTSSSLSELVLLHGAAFTKEDWKSSGILDKFCDINNNEDEGNLSTTAWDLPVSANGDELIAAYTAMVEKGALSGGAVTFVTPSASGKALTSLGESTDNDAQQNDKLKLMVNGWISVASGSVLKTTDEALSTYFQASVPVLAIHGDEDAMGKKVTERLVRLGAKGVELEGRHPVYLDSPDEFIMEVLKFMDEHGL